MSTAFRDISAALNSTLNTYVTTNSIDASWPNDSFKPTTGTLYLRPTFLPASVRGIGVSDTSSDENLGVYQIDIFAQLDKGDVEAKNMADDLADLFKRGSEHTYNGVLVRIRSASCGAGTRDGAWWKVPVFFEYRSFTASR